MKKKTVSKKAYKKTLPVLPLRGLVVYPNMTVTIDASRPESIEAIEYAMKNGRHIALVAQYDEREEIDLSKIYSVGTVGEIRQMIKVNAHEVRVVIDGLFRVYVYPMSLDLMVTGVCERLRTDRGSSTKEKKEAYRRTIIEQLNEYAQLVPTAPKAEIRNVTASSGLGEVADFAAATVLGRVYDRQVVLSEMNEEARAVHVITLLTRELEIAKAQREIFKNVRSQVEGQQRDMFLREQLHAIRRQLGEEDEEGEMEYERESEEYRKKLEEASFPDEVREKIENELKKLDKTPPMSQESAVIRTWLDTVFELPWNTQSTDESDISRSQEILRAEHYGLEEVKDRIIEHLCVMQLTKNNTGSILCLVGPPGVGKTSVARSIANAMNRKYIRISLGGVRDEAEIRGHRKTYVGSMPGRIINAMRTVGTNNPLVLLDEIDKLGSDYKGDPASALLEVLDSEQNHAFRDHYLELPFDLSKVFFVTTANTTDTIPAPLLDRMEIVELPGYIEEDKVLIAKRFLIPKQEAKNGLLQGSLKLSDAVIREIIRRYTAEAGVRQLEREIAKIARKQAKSFVAEKTAPKNVTKSNLTTFLDIPKFDYDKIGKKDEVGVVTGLAWTRAGGDTMPIEVNVYEGTGKVELTGNLGDVMKESAKVAIGCLRAHTEQFGISSTFYKDKDIHIHVPEGAIPKDGPSAGVTMATALLSALSCRPVRHDIAMTGEINLRGKVMPIGGLREKTMAAYRSGVKTVLYPKENEKDTVKIPEVIKQKLTLVPVSTMPEVAELALMSQGKD